MQRLGLKILSHGLAIAAVLGVFLVPTFTSPKALAQQECFEVWLTTPKTINGPGTYPFVINYYWPGSGSYWKGSISFRYSGEPVGDVYVRLNPSSVDFQFPGRTGDTTISINVEISFSSFFAKNPKDFDLKVTAWAQAVETRGPTCRFFEVSHTYSYKAPSVPFDFTLLVDRVSDAVSPSDGAVFTIGAQVTGRTTDRLWVEVSGLPPDAEAQSTTGEPGGIFVGASLPPERPIYLRIFTADSTPEGQYLLTITGYTTESQTSVAKKKIRSRTVTLIVKKGASTAPFDFTVSASPDSQNVKPGETASFNLTIPVTGMATRAAYQVGGWYDSSEKLYKMPGVPAGASAVTRPYSGAFLPSVPTTLLLELVVTTSSETPVGQYKITVPIAIWDDSLGKLLTRSTAVTLTVGEPATFDISVFPSSPQEMVEGEIKGAGWNIKITWTGASRPVEAKEEISVRTEPGGFEDLRRESIRASWVGNKNRTAGLTQEETLRLSLDVDRLPNSLGHQYPISYVDITLVITDEQGLTKTITLPPLKILSVNANWSAALPANRLLAEAITPELTSGNEPIFLPPDFKSPDVERRQFDEEARMPLLVFKPSAPQIVSWVRIGPVFPINPPTLRWEWIDPNGTTVRTFNRPIPPTPNRGEFWRERKEFDTLDNPGVPTGLWKVKIFLNEELIATQLFRIVAAPPPTVPPAPAPAPAPPGGAGQGAGLSCGRRAQANSGQVTTDGGARLDIGFILGGMALLYLTLLPRRRS